MFDNFLKDLSRLQRRLQRLEGTQAVPFSELFPDDFMLLNTDYSSITAMMADSGFHIENADDFAAIPDMEWDVFVNSHTRFASWEAMRSAAATEWASRQLREG